MPRLADTKRVGQALLPRIAEVGPAVPRIPGPRPPTFRQGEVTPVDLRSLLCAFRRRLVLFILVTAAILGAVAVATLLAKPKYEAVAEVMIDPRNQKITNTADVLSSLPADSVVVDSEVEVLKSPQLAERVTRSLGLDRDPEFTRGLKARPAPPLSGEPYREVVNAVRKNLNVRRSGLTYAIQIGFRSQSAAKAARIANEFATLYLNQQVEQKVEATDHAAQWLNGRLQQLRTQVLSDDTAVQQFKIANNLMSAQGTTLTEQEISNYNQSLAQATAQVAEDQARLDTARSQLAAGSNGDDVGEALNSPTIQKLKEQRAEVSRRVASLQTQFRDEYPSLKIAKNELADIDAAIAAETRRVISNLDARAKVSRGREAAIAASLATARGQLATNNRTSVRLNELERNAQASRSLYESYLTRYKETSTQEGLAQPDARLVSLAPPPTKPSSPNLRLNAIVGVVLALAGGLAAVGLAETFDAGIATAADVEKRLDMRYLGALPLLRTSRRRTRSGPINYVVDHPFSGFSEAFRSLRATIANSPSPVPVKTVAVTSALPREGKTTTAICLARSAALQGFRVVIVDCDLRRASLSRLLNLQVADGLLEVLAGKAGLAQTLVQDLRTDAHVLPLSGGPLTPEDVFDTPAMDRLLAHLAGLYDLVLLDLPPVLPVADARILARKADFAVMVARWRRTPYQAIAGALNLLSSNNVEVGGLVLNQVDMEQQSRYGYGDTAYYFKSYRTYYLDAPDRAKIT
jgi:capsular exopolysaccharide synthesis family protein